MKLFPIARNIRQGGRPQYAIHIGQNENEKGIYSYLSEILSDLENATIFEIGVGWGDDTERILSLCKHEVSYHAFEPDPRNINIIKQSNVFDKINLLECAIGNIDGDVFLYLSDGNTGLGKNHTLSSSIKTPKTHLYTYPSVTFQDKTEVKVIKLDTYCENNRIKNIDFIWADMQGAEGLMIEGGPNTLKNTKYLYMEYARSEEYEGQLTLEMLLSSLPEFDIIKIFPDDVLLRNKRLTNL